MSRYSPRARLTNTISTAAVANWFGNQFVAIPTGFESIATATGTGSSGTITFSSIPSTYQHLQLRSIASSTSSYFLITFNSDSSASYSTHFLYGDGTSASATGVTSGTYTYGSRADNSTNLSAGIIDILDYTSTNKYKTIKTLTGQDSNGSGVIMLNSGLWQKTNAITSITLTTQSGNFATTNLFALYGIKGA